MGRNIPERYAWAVEILDVQPDDRILEIGCGYGHAIASICEKLRSGHLTAIDRSEKMVKAVTAANAEAIASGKVSILHTDLLPSGLPASHYEKIFLFNINAFWMDPVDELAEVRRLLKSSGAFYIFHQPPPAHELDEFIREFERNLSKNGFIVSDVFFERNEDIRSLCAISHPA